MALSLVVCGQTPRGGEDAARGAASGDRPRGPDGGFRPGRGGRFLDDVKAQIRASDEEWRVIGPKLRNLVFSRQVVEGGDGPRRGGFGGPPPGSPEGPGSAGSRGADIAPLIQAQADLQAALADPETSDDSVRERLAVLREARQKARVELAAATKDLLELLTIDQEAMLVSLGYLD
jgi:hypothetical protein